MKYILDASVALKWVLPEPLADKARQLRADFRIHIHELLAPDAFPAEVGHLLAGKLGQGNCQESFPLA